MNIKIRSKILGQCFLHDKSICKKIVELFDINNYDEIIEIGSGYGALTSFIYEINKNFTIIEIDNFLCNELYKLFPKIKIINKNVLDIDFNKNFIKNKYKIISNLPFNISKQIIKKIIFYFLSKIDILVIMLQKEVANNILFHNSVFGCLVYCNFSVEKYFTVNRKSFNPKPKVDCIVLKLQKINNNIEDQKDFFYFLCNCFKSKNKILKNNINLSSKFSIYEKNRIHELDREKVLEIYKNNEDIL